MMYVVRMIEEGVMMVWFERDGKMGVRCEVSGGKE